MKKNLFLFSISLACFVSAMKLQAQNTNLGTNAGNLGTSNTSIGYFAGDVVTGSANTFTGAYTGVSNTSAHSNSFFGMEAGYANTTGSYNTYLGRRAGFSANGIRNVFIGYGASYYGTSGDNNVHVGMLTGSFNNGSNNVILGSSAGYNISNVSGSVFIGYQAGYFGGSNQLHIANNYSSTLIYGDFSTGSVGLGTTSPGSYRLYVNGDAFATGLWVSSDKRFKQEIKKMEGALDKISSINGVSYRFAKNQDTGNRKFSEGVQLGLIAQDIQKVFPELVHDDGQGYLAVNYQGMIPVLLEAVKELKEQNRMLKAEVAGLSQLVKGKTPDQGSLQNAIPLLRQNTPNPFRGDTRIGYYLPKGSNATILVHDMNGEPVKTFENLAAGEGEVFISGSELKAGLYYYTIVVDGNVVDSKKMILTDK